MLLQQKVATSLSLILNQRVVREVTPLLDGGNQDGQPRVEDPALEAGGGGKDGSVGGVTKMGLANLGQNQMNLFRKRCGDSLMSTG
jgi:hypothetical protein